MLPFEISFDRPDYLWLLAVVPLAWWIARGSRQSLGRARWLLAGLVRSVLFALLVLALAEVHIERTHRGLTVIYLVDRSLSIEPDRIADVLRYVHEATAAHARLARDDRVGVIVFGAAAAIEAPPWKGDLALPAQFEVLVDREQTNLAEALELARAAFPPDAAKRVVVISDGNETLGSALEVGQRLADEGIGIDVVPVPSRTRADSYVDKVVAPHQTKQGEPFDVRIVLAHDAGDGSAEPVGGRLVVERRLMGRDEVVTEQAIELGGRPKIFTIRDQVDASGFLTYRARFVPDDPNRDAFQQNNEASAFSNIAGRARALLIVEPGRGDEFRGLIELLEVEKIEVTIQPTDRLFSELAELQSYDVVILADVPRSGGDDIESLVAFSDRQVNLLAENTETFGCGLVMLGGPNSFGVGGWSGTAVERAMPVDFQIKNPEIVPSGALMLVIDRSGSMSGEKIELSKAAAIEAVKVLGPRDYIGVVAFDFGMQRIVPLTQVTNREAVIRRIARLGADGGTDLQPALIEGFRQLRAAKASVKHMIVLTDGMTPPRNCRQLAADMRRGEITVTTVAVGPDSDARLLRDIALAGGGKYYQVNSPRAIPRIFMREARRVARPLVFEDERGFSPVLAESHEITGGLAAPLAPLTGYVMTTPKTSPLVELLMTAPRPQGQVNALLAAWQFGLGRSVAFTTDTGQRWTQAWGGWPGRERLWTQMVRWAMRTQAGDERYLVSTAVRGSEVAVVLTAIDGPADTPRLLAPRLAVVGPQAERFDAPLRQEAPGRYVGSVRAEKTGPYFLLVATEPGQPPLRVGVNVGYSDEFRRRDENRRLIEQLAALRPRRGAPGRVIRSPGGAFDPDELKQVDVFRDDLRHAHSRQVAWHLCLLVAGCLLLGDVLQRRVMLGALPLGAAMRSLAARLVGRRESAAPAALERLRHRKQQVQNQWAAQKAELVEPPRQAEVDAPTGPAPIRPASEARAAAALPAETADASQSSSYMRRLKKAKTEATRRRG